MKYATEMSPEEWIRVILGIVANDSEIVIKGPTLSEIARKTGRAPATVSAAMTRTGLRDLLDVTPTGIQIQQSAFDKIREIGFVALPFDTEAVRRFTLLCDQYNKDPEEVVDKLREEWRAEYK